MHRIHVLHDWMMRGTLVSAVLHYSWDLVYVKHRMMLRRTNDTCVVTIVVYRKMKHYAEAQGSPVDSCGTYTKSFSTRYGLRASGCDTVVNTPSAANDSIPPASHFKAY